MKKAKSVKRKLSNEERKKKFFEAKKRLLDRHGFVELPAISFPEKARVPFLSKIAMSIIKLQGGIMHPEYIATKQ